MLETLIELKQYTNSHWIVPYKVDTFVYIGNPSFHRPQYNYIAMVNKQILLSESKNTEQKYMNK